MRLIDADALYETVKDHVTTVSVCPTVDWARGKAAMKEICLEDIQNAPTIDAAPVVHGRWEEKMEHMGLVCCSVCHDCYVEKEWIFNKKWAWCPQCGARMDGGETDGKS